MRWITIGLMWVFALILISKGDADAQAKKISGTVYAFERFPLQNITVEAKKAGTTAKTDTNGKFEIEVKNKEVISIREPEYVNYSKKLSGEEKTLKINLIIRSDERNMAEVVRKGHISGEDLEYGKTQLWYLNNEFAQFKDAYDAVKYALPQATIIYENGKKGIQFRGPKTIQGSNMALTLVDGVITDDLSFIVPASIIRITRLSQQSAALYGSRAMNGVISIETR